MAKKTDDVYYLIHYRDPVDGKNISLKAKKIKDSNLGLSFIAISDFVFETNSILVNPDEEARKIQFEKVKTLHLSIYSIQSISEVGPHQKGLSFKNNKSNLLLMSPDPQGNPTN